MIAIVSKRPKAPASARGPRASQLRVKPRDDTARDEHEEGDERGNSQPESIPPTENMDSRWNAMSPAASTVTTATTLRLRRILSDDDLARNGRGDEHEEGAIDHCGRKPAG